MIYVLNKIFVFLYNGAEVANIHSLCQFMITPQLISFKTLYLIKNKHKAVSGPENVYEWNSIFYVKSCLLCIHQIYYVFRIIVTVELFTVYSHGCTFLVFCPLHA